MTGATGFVGRQLVGSLGDGANLLLVSRDPIDAARRHPGIRVCGYEELARHNLSGSTFVHLAVRNNDRPGTLEEFRKVNVEFMLEVAATAKRGGAARFVNLCSTHALQPKQGDLYGRSKQEGATRLRAFWPDGAVNLYVPAVYGTSFGGRLRSINRLPAVARSPVLAMLRLAKPMLSLDVLRDTLQIIADDQADRRHDADSSEWYLADPVPDAGLYAGIKRTVDLVAAVAVIALAGWAMLLIALYIRLDSKGQAIFAQKRVGRHGRTFTCLKFRTMRVGTADAATHDTSVDALTKAGRILRRTKLDELPQVVNVIRNEMSLVGPRPCLPIQQELIERRASRDVLTLKPGITGLAQIQGVDMRDPARLAALDDRYRAFRTLPGDWMIILRTVLGGGSGDRVRTAEHA
jgi:lipopolysaccharide/colanic/teichoic acid biosynthesis glycosyltransferase